MPEYDGSEALVEVSPIPSLANTGIYQLVGPEISKGRFEMAERTARLLHVTTVPQSLNFLSGQVQFMDVRGFEIEAVSSPGDMLTAFGEVEAIQVHAVEFPRRITPFRDIKAVWLLSRIIRSFNPTIVHAHTPKGGLLGMISAWIARVPVRIYHIRGLPYMSASGRKRALLKATERLACRLANRVFCVSHSIRDVAVSDGLCAPGEIAVFGGGSGNGVDATKRFNPLLFSPAERAELRSKLNLADSDLVIGFVGRIVRDKGIEELAKAWLSIRDDYQAARLLLIGPIEPQDPFSQTTLELLRNDPRVVMTGSVGETSPYYSILDLVVLPTYREGLPNVPLEGAAMELPVVATRIPGCVDAIEDGVTGTLVPVRDCDALAAAIRTYLDDPELRRRQGLAGRKRVLRDFRQEVIWEAVYQEYCRLLTEKGLPLPQPTGQLAG